MAKTNTGILHSFVGTLAPVTGYLRNGQNIFRSGISNVKYKHTFLRTEQLEKIKVCNRFIKAFGGTRFFNRTFPAYNNSGNGYNYVTRFLMNQALLGNYPHIHLSYSRVMISKGKLPQPLHAAATTMTDANIYFSFTDNSDTETASSIDKVILVAYCEELNCAIFNLNAGMRKDCEAVLQTSLLKGYTVETWIGFLSNDETDASDSFYTGKLRL